MYIDPMYIKQEPAKKNDANQKPSGFDMYKNVTKKMKKSDANNKVELELFKDYQEELAKHPQQSQGEVQMNFYQTENNFEYLKQVLLNYDNLSDQQFYDLIFKHYKEILQAIFNGAEQDKVLTTLFTNSRTLNIIGQVFYNDAIRLTYDEKIYCNKLAYDFMFLNDKVPNYEHVVSLMMIFCKIVNRDIIPSVQALNLPEDLAAALTMSAYSSMKEEINVKRLNMAIIGQPSELMTEKMITDIYCVLLKNRSITKIIEGILFDVWNENDLDTEDKEEIYATINLALLNLLEDLPSKILRSALNNYVTDKEMLYPTKPVRFNIRSFAPSDYPRLDNNLKWIDTQDGYQNYC